MGGDDLTNVYYFALLYPLGCTASADRQAQVAAGDDVSSRRWFSEADYTDRGELRIHEGVPKDQAVQSPVPARPA